MNRQLLLLIVIAVFSVSSVVVLLVRSPDQKMFEAAPLLATLNDAEFTLREIDITPAGGAPFKAINDDGQWRISPADYPADAAKISSLISALQQAERIEQKTTNPARYGHLGVAPFTQADSQASLVVLNGDESNALIVGKPSKSGQGHYVRFQHQATSWLVDQTLPVPASSEEWLYGPLIPSNFAQPQQVSKLGEKGWQVQLTEQGYQLEPTRSQPLKYPSIVDDSVGQLLGTRIQGLASEQQWLEATPVAAFQLVQDGKTLEMQIALEQSQPLVMLSSDDDKGYWTNRILRISSFSLDQFNREAGQFFAPVEDRPIQHDGEE